MLATPAAAQDAAEFYKGKTVSILMGTGPGASYDLYGRTIAEHKVKMLVQFTLERASYLKDVPTLTELTPPAMRDVAEFVVAGTPFARALAGPARAYRVAALRKAFDALMTDHAFLADAEKRNLDVGPRDAAQVTALVNKLTAASPELLARVK